MGVYIAPDIFQDKMIALMDYLDFIRVYINDFLVISLGSFEEHISKVEEVMKQILLDEKNAILVSAILQYLKENNWDTLLRERVSNRTQLF